jgi:hypothetical protein
MCCFQNELYCLRCHDKMGIPICGACRRPIEERVVTALGKHWHVEVSVTIMSSCLCSHMYSLVLLFALCRIHYIDWMRKCNVTDLSRFMPSQVINIQQMSVKKNIKSIETTKMSVCTLWSYCAS